METIAKAIIKVMQQVKGMEKNSKVGTGNSSYDGTKDQDVKEVFNQALAENGLCMLPIGIEEETKIDRWQEESTWNGKTSLKQKQSVFTKVKTKYLLLHESGESIELAGYGHGVDSQDKGAGKATTYAMKNALLYAFVTPVGKIDDTDLTHSQDISTPTKAVKQNIVSIPADVLQDITTKLKKAKTQDELADLYKVEISKINRYPSLKGMFTSKKVALNGNA